MPTSPTISLPIVPPGPAVKTAIAYKFNSNKINNCTVNVLIQININIPILICITEFKDKSSPPGVRSKQQ
jgi:hypothetical protein